MYEIDYVMTDQHLGNNELSRQYQNPEQELQRNPYRRFGKLKRFIIIIAFTILLAFGVITLVNTIYSSKDGSCAVHSADVKEIEYADEVKLTKVSSWNSEGQYGYVLNLTLTDANFDNKDWSVELTFPSNITLKDSWDGTYSTNANKLTILPLEEAKSSETPITFGFMVYSDKEINLEYIEVAFKDVKFNNQNAQ